MDTERQSETPDTQARDHPAALVGLVRLLARQAAREALCVRDDPQAQETGHATRHQEGD